VIFREFGPAGKERLLARSVIGRSCLCVLPFRSGARSFDCLGPSGALSVVYRAVADSASAFKLNGGELPSCFR